RRSETALLWFGTCGGVREDAKVIGRRGRVLRMNELCKSWALRCDVDPEAGSKPSFVSGLRFTFLAGEPYLIIEIELKTGKTGHFCAKAKYAADSTLSDRPAKMSL